MGGVFSSLFFLGGLLQIHDISKEKRAVRCWHCRMIIKVQEKAVKLNLLNDRPVKIHVETDKGDRCLVEIMNNLSLAIEKSYRFQGKPIFVPHEKEKKSLVQVSNEREKNCSYCGKKVEKYRKCFQIIPIGNKKNRKIITLHSDTNCEFCAYFFVHELQAFCKFKRYYE